jgi:ribosomal protein S18 acetylase RimI-like enzyme
MFKMTNACRPVGLDELLDELDFKIEMQTHFQIAELKNLLSLNHSIEVQIDADPTFEWFEAYTQISGFSERAMSARRGIITDIKLKKALASVRTNGSIVGIGLGVLHNNWVGFFSVGTDSEYRRKGIGKSVNQALAVWAEGLGAERAYLQVEVDNYPAITLYEEMGFKTLYNYWYRVRRS